MDAPDTLDVHQAAALLHADEETILVIARSGELPGTKIGRSWVFLRSDVLTFLRARIEADTTQRRQAAQGSHLPLAVAMPVLPASGRRRTVLPRLPELPLGPPLQNKSP